jgi:8-oxo-dGTP diphosphatase
MPGGKINLGEPISNALQREVMEEVGLEVAVEEMVDVFEHVTPGEDNYHFVILYYRCRPLSCDISHNRHEVAEARWVPAKELLHYSMPDGTRFILGKVFPFQRRHDDGIAP